MPSNTLALPPRAPSPLPAVIRFACASCGEKLSVPQKYAGRKGACPSCGGVNRVPGGAFAPGVRPVFVELPQPAADLIAAPTLAASAAHDATSITSEPVVVQTPYADTAAAPLPARNAGAELTERPDRWTRGPVKIDPPDDEVGDGSPGGLLRFFVEGGAEEEQWVLGHRRQWEVDKRGLPKFARVGLLLGSVLALVGLVWGFFYVLLKVVIAVNG